jgi:hypothetical protein
VSLRSQNPQNGVHSKDVFSLGYLKSWGIEKCMILLKLLMFMAVGHHLVLKGRTGESSRKDNFGEDVVI